MESEDDSEIGGDLELNEAERQMLEMADVDDIEDLVEEDTALIGKKRKKPVQIQMETEMEYETEQPRKSKVKVAAKNKRPKQVGDF